MKGLGAWNQSVYRHVKKLINGNNGKYAFRDHLTPLAIEHIEELAESGYLTLVRENKTDYVKVGKR